MGSLGSEEALGDHIDPAARVEGILRRDRHSDSHLPLDTRGHILFFQKLSI